MPLDARRQPQISFKLQNIASLVSGDTPPPSARIKQSCLTAKLEAAGSLNLWPLLLGGFHYLCFSGVDSKADRG